MNIANTSAAIQLSMMVFGIATTEVATEEATAVATVIETVIETSDYECETGDMSKLADLVLLGQRHAQ